MNEDQEKLKKPADLLKSASDMLLSVRPGGGGTAIYGLYRYVRL